MSKREHDAALAALARGGGSLDAAIKAGSVGSWSAKRHHTSKRGSCVWMLRRHTHRPPLCKKHATLISPPSHHTCSHSRFIPLTHLVDSVNVGPRRDQRASDRQVSRTRCPMQRRASVLLAAAPTTAAAKHHDAHRRSSTRKVRQARQGAESGWAAERKPR